jgi:hypothetical protein
MKKNIILIAAVVLVILIVTVVILYGKNKIPFSETSLTGWLWGGTSSEDKITSIGKFTDLPDGIKRDLSKKYSQASIKSGIRWDVSTTSITAIKTLKYSNLINKVSGGVLAALEGGKDKVYEWLLEETAKTLGGSIISYGTSDAVGDVSVLLYDSYQLNKKVAGKTFKAITKSSQLSAEVAAWVLNAEMTYINNNVSKGFSELANKNWGGGSLVVYIVGVEGENFEGRVQGGKLISEQGVFDKGLKFYYYDTNSRAYKNYFDDIVSTKIQVTKTR